MNILSCLIQYVLKRINLKKASSRERKSAEQEAKLLSKLKHPNIVSYKDSFEKEGFLYIAMQYCEGGDLYNKLKEQKGTLLDERQLVEWFVQIAMALQVTLPAFSPFPTVFSKGFFLRVVKGRDCVVMD